MDNTTTTRTISFPTISLDKEARTVSHIADGMLLQTSEWDGTTDFARSCVEDGKQFSFVICGSWSDGTECHFDLEQGDSVRFTASDNVMGLGFTITRRDGKVIADMVEGFAVIHAVS